MVYHIWVAWLMVKGYTSLQNLPDDFNLSPCISACDHLIINSYCSYPCSNRDHTLTFWQTLFIAPASGRPHNWKQPEILLLLKQEGSERYFMDRLTESMNTWKMQIWIHTLQAVHEIRPQTEAQKSMHIHIHDGPESAVSVHRHLQAYPPC